LNREQIHYEFRKNQGLLSNALTKVNNTMLYQNIKDKKIDPNELIKYTKERFTGKIIIGSFNKKRGGNNN